MKRVVTIIFLAATFAGCNKDKAKDVYTVNSTSSLVKWKGSAPDHFHLGSFQATGSFNFNKNTGPGQGEFVIPISSIDDYDLPPDLKIQLLTHLKSPDFFNMAMYPNATFKLKKWAAYAETTNPGLNQKVTGDFTMLGKTIEISFPAKVSTTNDSLKLEASFSIDRTKWGMTSFTNPEAELYILPEVELELVINAGRK